MGQTTTINLYIIPIFVFLLFVKGTVYSQITENYNIFNTCKMEFPVFWGNNIDTDNDSIIILIKPLFNKQYHQCIINHSYYLGDTLIIELNIKEQIIEVNDNYVISIQKNVIYPKFCSLKVIKKGKDFKTCIIEYGEKNVVLYGRKKRCVRIRTNCSS